MSYKLTATLAIGSENALDDLRAQLIDEDGVDYGDEISTGFSSGGGDFFLFTYDQYPDGFRGGVRIYNINDPTETLTVLSINPEEAENLDMKVSQMQPQIAITTGVR
jgi:hypothetical protein